MGFFFIISQHCSDTLIPDFDKGSHFLDNFIDGHNFPARFRPVKRSLTVALFLSEASPFFTAADPYASKVMMLGIILSLTAFGQFFGSPFLGSLSDTIGRRKTLVYSCLATAFSYFIGYWRTFYVRH